MNPILLPLTHFKEQFNFVPLLHNRSTVTQFSSVVICGMGGSAICVSLLKVLFPELELSLHNSYGLPQHNKESTLFILNSFSGNTEEVLDTYERCMKENLHFAVLSCGGELISRAQLSQCPYIQIPKNDLEPRFSIGYQLVSLLSLLGEDSKIQLLRERITLLDMTKVEQQGKELAETFLGKYPILYASPNLYPIAYLIKAAINEGAKIPSFVNVIPEANHNELQSFVTDDTVSEKENFGFLFIPSTYDPARILKRFSVMETLYRERGFTVATHTTNHTDILAIFETIVSGYYMATYMALAKNIDPYKTPLIAEFKERMKL